MLGRHHRRYFMLPLLASLLAVVSSVSADEPSASRTLVAALPPDFPPTYFRDPGTGKAAGLAVDVMDELARRAGVKVEYHFAKAWDEIEDELLDGKADIIPFRNINEKTARKFIFTKALDTTAVCYIQRATDQEHKEPLPGMRLGVIKGSTAHEAVKERRDIAIVTYESLYSLLMELLTGRVDMILTSAPNIMRTAEEAGLDDRLRVVRPSFSESVRGIALRRGEEELRDRLDKALDSFVNTPEARAIYTRWLGKPKPWWNTRRVVAVCASLIVVMLMGVAVWHYSLMRRMNRELERRVAERTAELLAANHEMETFTYSVSHDLRSPLRGVNGWVTALREDCHEQLDDKAKNYIERACAEARHLGNLIDALLQLSRVSRGEMRKEQVDLSAMAAVILDRLRSADDGRKVEVAVQPGLKALGDPNLVEIVLANLLGNAWKYTGRREVGRIEFGEVEIDGRRTLFVRDNGAGFDMAYAQKLFGPFQRLHKTSEFPGTGIGLAIVQRIVLRHGGRIWAEAKVDEGAVFYLTLSA